MSEQKEKEIKDIIRFYANEWHYRAIHKDSDGETLISYDNGKKARAIMRKYFNENMDDKWGDE